MPTVKDPVIGNIYRVGTKTAFFEVCELGATLKRLVLSNQDILLSFNDGELPLYGQGQILFPFPNRIKDGSYYYMGSKMQLPINETKLNNAIHGLVRFEKWQLVQRGNNFIELCFELLPQPGYPFRIIINTHYFLASKNSLFIRFIAKNLSPYPAPTGLGIHPYFKLKQPINNLILKVPAKKYYRQNSRKIPTAAALVKGSNKNFYDPKLLGNTVLDDCFFDIDYLRDASTVTLSDPDNNESIKIGFSKPFSYLMIFTADTLPRNYKRAAIAIEPMTCPPNAFNRSLDNLLLNPGRSIVAKMSITYLRDSAKND